MPSRAGRSARTVSTLRSTSRSIEFGVDPGKVELDDEPVVVLPGVHRHQGRSGSVPNTCWVSRSRSRNGSVRINMGYHLHLIVLLSDALATICSG